MYLTYELGVFIWIALAIMVFPIAIKKVAPYGRHSRSGWGPMIDNKLGWILMEFPALIIMPLFYFYGDADKNIVTHLLCILFFFHYVNRVLIFPFRIKTKGKKIPLLIALFAFLFNIINGSIIGYHLGFLHQYSEAYLTDPKMVIGLMIFLIGVYINWRSDHMLINLRKENETGYKIPKGWLFDKISCPNHFGEIIEWIGYAIMLWSLPGWSFAIWTAANLIPRSLNHHSWYKSYFKNYPTERKAVIPSIL